MKLYLDDERRTPIGWERAYTVDEAIATVIAAEARGEPWMDASLDHDLAEEHYMSPFMHPDYSYDHARAEWKTQCGLDFVDWMVRTNTWPINKPVVHSMNPVGRQRMQQTIDRYFPK